MFHEEAQPTRGLTAPAGASFHYCALDTEDLETLGTCYIISLGLSTGTEFEGKCNFAFSATDGKVYAAALDAQSYNALADFV